MDITKARRSIGTVLIVLAVAFAVYLSVVMIRRINTVVLKATYTRIFCYELAACAFLILFAADVRFGFTGAGNTVLKAAGWCLRVTVVLVTAVLLFFIGKITVGSLICTEAPVKNAVVLGLALENGKPTDDLVSRLDTAEKYLRRNPDATLILTGGNPDESGRTEAAVMRDLLTERGIREDRMILEDRAKTTKDNFRNTARLISPDEPIVLISSNYHMDRAVRTAQSAGFSKVLRLPAPSSLLSFGANVMWEVTLELNELFFRQ
jgi:uncharacterized SAM-binding protein YcdF (DUF218 family)